MTAAETSPTRVYALAIEESQTAHLPSCRSYCALKAASVTPYMRRLSAQLIASRHFSQCLRPGIALALHDQHRPLAACFARFAAFFSRCVAQCTMPGSEGFGQPQCVHNPALFRRRLSARNIALCDAVAER